jgi:hypothetical protein
LFDGFLVLVPGGTALVLQIFLFRASHGDIIAHQQTRISSKLTTKQAAIVTPEHSDDGVDLTPIRWMLSLTPRERLAVLQDQVDSLLTLRAKFESQVFGNTGSP